MYKTIPIQDLHECFVNLGPNELILDVRTPQEYAEGHVPKSKNISHELVGTHANELKQYKKVYLYCRSGGRVQVACSALEAAGLNNLTAIGGGGMPDWVAAGHPVER